MRASDMYKAVESNTRQYEGSLRAVEREISTLNDKELRLQSQISRALSQIAAIQMQFNPTVFSDAQRQLDMRSQEEATLRKKLGEIERSIASVMQRIGEVRAQLETAKSTVQQRLAGDAKLAQLVAEKAAKEQEWAAAKDAHADILKECERKLPAYESNDLYQYLVAVGYKTDTYDRKGLLRSLDRWIAGLCNFERSRADHLTLIAMRDEILGHDREGSNSVIAGLSKSIDDLIKQAETECGLQTLSGSLDKEQKNLKDLKSQANEIHGGIDAYVNRTDGRYLKAQELMKGFIAHMSGDQLLALAAKTETPEDDILAKLVIDKQAEIKDLHRSQALLQEQRSRANEAYLRAKQLERSIDRSNYNSSSYQYSSGLDVTSLLAGYMAGTLSERAALSQVNEYRSEVVRETYRSSYSSSGSSSSSGSGGSGYTGFGGSSSSNNDDDNRRSSDSGGGGSFFDTSGSSDSGSFTTSDSF